MVSLMAASSRGMLHPAIKLSLHNFLTEGHQVRRCGGESSDFLTSQPELQTSSFPKEFSRARPRHLNRSLARFATFLDMCLSAPRVVSVQAQASAFSVLLGFAPKPRAGVAGASQVQSAGQFRAQAPTGGVGADFLAAPECQGPARVPTLRNLCNQLVASHCNG